MRNWILLAFLLSSFQSAYPRPFDSFDFGIATAPGQTEDLLNDAWSAWGKAGKIAGFLATPQADDRLQSWSHPDPDLDLIAATGIQTYRMGVDWGRIMPAPHQFDQHVIQQYRELIHKIKARNLKVMLTLMHHSIPVWAQSEGGWLQDRMIDHFLEFSKRILQEYESDVDYWITFNEGNIFAVLSYTAGMWPPGETRSIGSLLQFGPWKGQTLAAMDRMADAHNALFDWAHRRFPKVQMGLAHNMAFYTGKSIWDRLKARFIDATFNWHFPEQTRNHLDFFGFNYYGAEWLKGNQIDIDPEEEYSEAGRAISPEGLYLLLKKIHERFSNLPILITENGIADSTDLLRPAYLIEHLKAVQKALEEQIPVRAYFVWTLADNLEWSDGYCPKFGLVDVDRKKQLLRTPRGSYFLFKSIVQSKEIQDSVRNSAWQTLAQNQGKPRPFCRAEDGIHALSFPTSRLIVKKDWRFHPTPGSNTVSKVTR